MMYGVAVAALWHYVQCVGNMRSERSRMPPIHIKRRRREALFMRLPYQGMHVMAVNGVWMCQRKLLEMP